PDRPGLAAALRRAGRYPAPVRRGGSIDRRDHARGPRRIARAPRRAHGGPGRVQAPAEPAGHQDLAARVRQGPAPADHEPLAGLGIVRHSYLSATIGSTFVARLAGTRQAMSATPASRSATPP